MNYIFTNARIFTMEEPCQSETDSLAVAKGRIACIGSLQACRDKLKSDFEIIDLRGKALLPSFTDCHTHFTEYVKMQYQVNLSGLTTIGEIKDALLLFRKKNPDYSGWILGGGWDKNQLDAPQELNFRTLDAIFPDIPVALFSKDYHSRWCNSVALRIAGITETTPDPAGGKIYRDESGFAIGILTETAAELVNPYIQSIPDAQLTNFLKLITETLYKYGLTFVHCMEEAAGARILEDFIRNTKALRVCRHFYADELDWAIEHNLISYNDDIWYKTGGVKLFADGALGSQTAAMFGEYPRSAGNRGILRLTEEEIYQIADKAASNGLSSLVHAIGDRAVHLTLSAFDRLKHNHYHTEPLSRIEHLQAIEPGDLALLKKSGVYCSMQPVHLANDIDMIEEHWPDIADRAYNFKSVLNCGVPLGFGSDAPIETINPFHGIYTAITRKKALNPAVSGWRREQNLTALEALHAYTLGAAKGSRSESILGSLKSGKLADLIVIDDFAKLPDEYWLEASSYLTMLDGKVVWSEGL